jgi:tryptophan synthase alpha subunit
MSNKIDIKLAELKKTGRKGLMTHVVVGFPSLGMTERLVIAMEQSGVDFVELQIPFSDPLADGPTIQSACEQSLAGGTKVKDAFVVATKLSKQVKIPLLFMGYFNTVFKYGVEKFCADAAVAGISGIIIPDAPLEAAQHEGLLAACKKYQLRNIITLAPTSTNDRLDKNDAIASGFVYCMSRQGVTGAKLGLDPDVKAYLQNVRQHVNAPMAVGFGISNRGRLDAVTPYCDIAVVGSALLDGVTEAQKAGNDPIQATQAFIKSLC